MKKFELGTKVRLKVKYINMDPDSQIAFGLTMYKDMQFETVKRVKEDQKRIVLLENGYFYPKETLEIIK